MGLGEELLADYTFEITEARDRYEESVEREYEFYENLKKGIWTNSNGDKVDLCKIDDRYFNNIINYCKKKQMPNGVIDEIISIRNDNLKMDF